MHAFLRAILAASALQDPVPPPAQDEEAPAGITRDWGGRRTSLAESGLTLNLNAVYTFQAVVGGGIDGLLLENVSEEKDTGHTGSFDLGLELDTEKAGLWPGGTLNFRLEGRAGRSVVSRAGTVSVVNIDAVIPNVTDRFDEEALAVTTFSVAQDVGGGLSLFAGLLDASEGDANEIAGHALSPDHFLNGAMLYSVVEDATVPNVALGGGLEWEVSDRLYGSFSVFGTEETAGESPFRHSDGGTTFSTEWTLSHELGGRGGAQTAGFLYGTEAERTNLSADPRIVLARLFAGLPVPTSSDPTWSFYYNAHQYVSGGAEGGWGLFVRAGFSDGDPNPVAWNFAAGAGGRGTFPGRDEDAWGAGVFVLDLSDEDLLRGLGLKREEGAEAYYTISITSGLRVTLDAQAIHSAIDAVDTTWLLGLRTTIVF